MEIKYPILLYYDGLLFADSGDGMKVRAAQFTKDHKFEHMEFHIEESEGWLLEYDGKFHRLTPSGKRYSKLRPIKWLFNFVKSEFSVVSQESISVEELLEIVNNNKKKGLAKDLIRFLSKQDPSKKIDQKLLDAWPI